MRISGRDCALTVPPWHRSESRARGEVVRAEVIAPAPAPAIRVVIVVPRGPAVEVPQLAVAIEPAPIGAAARAAASYAAHAALSCPTGLLVRARA